MTETVELDFFRGGRVNYLTQCMSCAHISEFVLLQSAEILGLGDGKLTNIFLKTISSPCFPSKSRFYGIINMQTLDFLLYLVYE